MITACCTYLGVIEGCPKTCGKFKACMEEESISQRVKNPAEEA
jgi:hypothetical protein